MLCGKFSGEIACLFVRPVLAAPNFEPTPRGIRRIFVFYMKVLPASECGASAFVL